MRSAALILKVLPEERWLPLSGACLCDERRIFTEITASRSLLFGSVFGLKFDSFSQRREKVRLDGPGSAPEERKRVALSVCLFDQQLIVDLLWVVGRSCSPMQAGDGCQRGSR